jgi:hypothetical protein
VDIDIVAIVLFEPARGIKTDGVRPVGFRVGDEFGESFGSRCFNAFREERARNSVFPVALEHCHSDNPCPAWFEQQTNGADYRAGMFCHEEVVTGRDKEALYIEEVGIQRVVDKSEMFTQSLKDNVSGFFLILRSKLSND